MKVRLCYAKRYATALGNNNNSELGKIQQLPPHSRLHAMKALTTLSKYLGCYDSWQQTRKRYNMKWTTGNESLQALHRFFDDSLSLDVMMTKVNEMIRLLGGFYGPNRQIRHTYWAQAWRGDREC